MSVESAFALLFSREALFLLTGVTVGLAAVSALVVPVLLARLPVDYLLTESVSLRSKLAASWGERALLLGRNGLGALLLLLGVLMLFMPGQGLLTVLVGLAMMDFPGKRGLERRLVARPSVKKAVDWIRGRGAPVGVFRDFMAFYEKMGVFVYYTHIEEAEHHG